MLSHLELLSLFSTLAVLTSGCATRSAVPLDAPSSTAVDAPSSSVVIPVVRQGRYTLVELAPQSFQKDLLDQVVTLSIPVDVDANVGAALRHVLLRTGYQLCDDDAATPLYQLPLPAAHLSLGPLTLRDALQTLAGPAWVMSVDALRRHVCFRPSATWLPNSAPAVDATEGADQ